MCAQALVHSGFAEQGRLAVEAASAGMRGNAWVRQSVWPNYVPTSREHEGKN
jgi:hypothetical protein